MTTTNTEQQDTEQQEQPEQYGSTVGERIAAMEAQQRLLIEIVRENGRRSDSNYQALDAKIDSKVDSAYQALDAKIDRLYRLLLTASISIISIGLAALVAFIVQLII